MDIAALGLSVDSGPAERAVAALRQLGPASRGAAAGADHLAGSAEREARAMSSASSAANDNARAMRVAGAAAAAAASAYDKATGSFDKSFAAAARVFSDNGITDNYTASLKHTALILDELRAKYNPLYAAGKQYATALADINQAARVGALTDGEHAKAVANLRSGYVSQISALRQNKAEVEANAKATGELGFQARQTLIQLPDVVQGIAGGQGVFRTAIQQGGQLVQIYGMGPGGVGGSLRQVGSELAALITPMWLVGGGVAAIVIATTAAVLSWKNYATALDDLSHITGTATAELSRLQTAASIKGIGQDDFAGGMRRFADAVYDAKAGTNDLATLLRLNGKTVSDTAGTLDTVAELVRRAKDDQQRLQILQQAGLPATMEWVRLLSSGADGLRAAKEEAAKFGGALNDEMVAKAREFDEAWNRAWTNFGISMRRTVVEGYDLLNRLIELGREAVAAFDKATGGQGLSTVGANLLKSGYGTPLSQNTGQLYGGLMAGQGSAGNDNVRDAAWLAQQQRAIQLEQQRIALLGEAATAADRRREVELRLQAAQLSGIHLTEDQKNKIRELAAEERSLAETQKALSVLGASATDDERYAGRMQELGIALKHNVINQERFNRAALDAHPVFGKLKSGMEEFTASMVEGFAKGEDMTKTLESALNSLSSSLIRMGSQNLIGSLFQGVSASGAQTGGLLGGGLTSLLGLGAAMTPGVGAIASLGIGAALSFLPKLFGGGKNDNAAQQAQQQAAQQAAQQLAEAQRRWAEMSKDFLDFVKEASGIVKGSLGRSVDDFMQRVIAFGSAAHAAGDYAGEAQAQAQIWIAIPRMVHEFEDAFANFGVEISSVQQNIKKVNDDAADLTAVLIQFGAATDSVALRVEQAMNRMRDTFLSDLARKIHDASGFGWVNELNDLVAEVAQLRADAAALGVQTAMIDQYYVLAAQNVINSSQLTGDAFNSVAAALGPLGSQLHEFSAEAEAAAQALKRSASEIAATIQGYQDQLFVAGQNTQTLSGALAVFDLQAQRDREAEIAKGGQALAALEALQAQQRMNIIQDFNARALDEQKRLQDEQKRLQEQQQQELERTIEKQRQYVASLQSLKASLFLGANSTLSPRDQLAYAQSQFASITRSAAAGDENARGQIQSATSAYLDAARAYYGSSDAYAGIFASVQNTLDSLIASGASGVSTEERQLSQMQTQTSLLSSINDKITPVSSGANSAYGAASAAANAAGIDLSWMSSLPGFPAYANGTDFHRGGMAIVGERGPEIVNLPRGSSVTPANDNGSAMAVIASTLERILAVLSAGERMNAEESARTTEAVRTLGRQISTSNLSRARAS